MRIAIRLRAAAAIVALLLPGLAPRAQEAGTAAEHVESPYFAIQGDAGVDQFPLKDTRVDVKLNGVIASVHLQQVYRNQGKSPINARYVFPGSTRAAVGGLTMTIGERRLRAQIKEKQQAAAIFAAAKSAGKSAALLSQRRPNVFSMDVANILPGDEVTIDLDYTEILSAESGTYEFVYPGVVGPRYTGDAARSNDDVAWLGNPHLRAGNAGESRYDIRVEMVSPLPINDLKSDTHALLSDWRGPKAVSLKLAEPGAAAANRDFILHYRLQGDALVSGLTRFRFGGEDYFMLLAEPPRRPSVAEIPARDYLFVVDVSGSMSGFPLDTARALLTRLLAGLGPRDSFNILFFAGDSQILSPLPLPASDDNRARAAAMLAQISGGGGTELLPALQRALAMPRNESQSRSIVLITDGYISAEGSAFRLIDEHIGDANLFTFGIGSSVNRFLIEGLARVGRSEAFVVTDAASAESEAERFRRYISVPVLTGISLTGRDIDLYDVEPVAQPDLLAERPLLVLGKYRNAGRQAAIELRGINGNGAQQWRFALGAADQDPNLPKLWARKRLERLYVFPGAAEDSRAQILQLGMKYSLLTSVTSFVAVDELARNPDGATDVKQPLPLPAGVSNSAVGGLRPMPEPDWLWLVGFIALLGVAAANPRKSHARA